MCYQVRFITRSVKCSGDNAMCDGMVRKWVRMFNEGRENVHDGARIGRPSLVSDDLVRRVNERVRDDRRFTISDLSLHFPQISRTLLYDILSSGYHRRRSHSMRRVYKNLCPATISASIMAANMLKNSLKNVESDNNKILYEILFDFFLQRNGAYFLNKPRTYLCISHSYTYNTICKHLGSHNALKYRELLDLFSQRT